MRTEFAAKAFYLWPLKPRVLARQRSLIINSFSGGSTLLWHFGNGFGGASETSYSPVKQKE